MTTRLVFLTVVCVGSAAFGQPPHPYDGYTPPAPTETTITVPPGTRAGSYIVRVQPGMPAFLEAIPMATPVPNTPAPATPAPKTPAPAKPAPATPYAYPSNPYYVDPFWNKTTVPPPATGATPLPVPAKPAPATPAPKTPAPMLSGLVPTASAPMEYSMKFHVGGNFDASFEMNVTQGQAKQKESPAKKQKSSAAQPPKTYGPAVDPIRQY